MPPYSSYQSYGSTNQPGQNNASGGFGNISTLPWGGGSGGSNNDSPWSNWAQMMQGSITNPSQSQGTGGWNQTSPGQWSMYLPPQLGQSSGGYTHTYQGATPPGMQPFFNIPQMAGQEAAQQQALYDQNREQMLGFGQSYFDQMAQMSQGMQDMGAQQLEQGQSDQDYFRELAGSSPFNVQFQNQEFQGFGGEAVDQVNRAADNFRSYVDSQQDQSAQRASSAMVGAQRAEQSRLQAMSDQFQSMGIGPEQSAMAQQELMAMGSMGRQQLLTEIQQQDRQYLSQLEQASTAIQMQAGQFSGQMAQANAAMRSNYDSMNAQGQLAADQFNAQGNAQIQQTYNQMYQAQGQMVFNNWMQTQATAAELSSQGFGAMSSLMQQYPHSSVSLLGTLLASANLMENTPLGSPDFAQQFQGMGGQPA